MDMDINSEEYIEQEVVSLRQALTELISSSIVEDFARVWSRIGLTSNQRKLRRETMGVHISSLLKDILQEEEELEKSMIDSLQNNEIELISLCKQLGFPTEALPSTRSLYEREKETRGRVDALNKVKFDRQKRLKRIREMENSLCKEMGETNKFSFKSALPSEEELKCYLQNVENLEHTLNERRLRHHKMMDHVLQLSTHLGLELDGEFEMLCCDAKKKPVYSLATMNMLEEKFQKFEEYVKELESEASGLQRTVGSLWERLETPLEDQQKVLEKVESFRLRDIEVLREELQRLERMKKEHMRTFIQKTREELSKIWEDCLYGVQQQREFSPAFEDGPYDDDLLSAHESELDRMRGFYQDNLEIFKLVQKREDMFKQHLELERKDNDPMRFSNRGGQLLKDQTLKKHIKKELPRVEKELNAVLVQWEEDHERFFMVHDSRYLDTVQLQWNQKEMNKCSEKVKRQKEKEALTLLEMTYGSKPTTPKKRTIKRAAPSPLAATAPAKLRKVEQSPLVRPTTTAGSRLPRAAKKRSAKTPVRPIQRRHNERRKILGENCNTLSAAIAVDDSVLSAQNFSLASSAGSYTDFQHGIMLSSEKQNVRSSILPKSSSMENIH